MRKSRTSPRRWLRALLCGALLPFLPGPARASLDEVPSEAERVLILANAADRSSLQIAAHYAAARRIPEANIVALPLSEEETITLGEYVETIHNPLRSILLEDGWLSGSATGETDDRGRAGARVTAHSISYLVVCRGVPVRISDGDVVFLTNGVPEDLQGWMSSSVAGSVDGELALLAAPPHPFEGFVANPLFGRPGGDHPEAARVIRVSRLDGASATDVIRLIDRTVLAEETGLMGRAYIDMGSGPAGAAETGDAWLQSVGTLAAGAGFDTFMERSRRLFGDLNRRDAPAIYAGWYRPAAYGPFLDPAWTIPPGAIAFHLHSFSATTVRSDTRAWVGPLVRLGFCATVGNVYEPTLGLTHRPQAFMQYLLEGRTWGEAVTASHPALSWQVLAIGDPLFRPFKTSLETQLSDEIKSPFQTYAVIRRVNQLLAGGETDAAFALAAAQMVERPSLALAYKLADLYRKKGKKDEAVKTLGIIEHLSIGAADEVMLFKEMADLLHRLGASAPAFQTYRRLVAYPGLTKQMRIHILSRGVKVARAAGQAALAIEWGVELDQLRPPPPGK